MLKLVKFGFWALVGLCLIIFALGNAQSVEVAAMPNALAGLLGVSPVVSLPLYAVVFFGVAFGLLIGFIWEWLREFKQRSVARRHQAEKNHLEQEVSRLKRKERDSDDILALIDDSAA